jgi:hypothetical protein
VVEKYGMELDSRLSLMAKLGGWLAGTQRSIFCAPFDAQIMLKRMELHQKPVLKLSCFEGLASM